MKFQDRISMQAIIEMADAVDMRDPYTGGHTRRVAQFASRIIRKMKIDGDEATLIASAARVHDIGKIVIPDEILKKPGKLTTEEFHVMQSHAEIGATLLSRYQNFTRGAAIVRHHHERWDGKGYPDGLKEIRIPLGARMIAVADSYDAMTTDRPYRAAMSPTQAIRILRDESGKQWDPVIVDIFMRVLSEQNAMPARSFAQLQSLSPNAVRVAA